MIFIDNTVLMTRLLYRVFIHFPSPSAQLSGLIIIMRNRNLSKICSKCKSKIDMFRGDVILNKATRMCWSCRIDDFPKHMHRNQYQRYYLALGKKLLKK